MKKLAFVVLMLGGFGAAAQTTYDRVIDSLYRPGEPGGVALVAQHGKTLYQRAFGMADLELNVPMQTQDLFEIGSMTKQFTAVCILQLAEQGKLKTDDTLGRFIDHCPPAWQGLRLEQLMTHTSGITDIGGPQGSLADILKLYAGKPLAFAPGTKRAYSNTGYALLGFVIEKVSGQTYPDYLQQHLLTPAGMTQTVYGNTSKIIPGRVPCYLRNKSGHGFQNAVFNIPPSAAGALLSNVSDLLKWNEALAQGRLITKASLQKAWASCHLADGKNTFYGYGWQTGGSIQGIPVVEHGGVAVGYLADALYMPNEGILVIVLSNQRGVLPEIAAAKLAAIATGKPDTVHVVSLAAPVLESYCGSYREKEDTTERRISFSDNHLYYQRSGGPRIEIKPIGADKVLFDNLSVIGIFSRDERGQPVSLRLYETRHPEEPTSVLQRSALP
jgi:CubicO group peptidase (beta-lactamase class C family)